MAALRDQVDWLLASDGGSDMLTERHLLFIRLHGVLADLAGQGPLVLVLEDLHWADESSRELLAFLAVRLREQPVLVIATLREDELAASARRLLAATVQFPEKRLLVCLREAAAAGLLAARGDSYAFPHTLIRQVLYGQLLPGDRRRLHRRLADEMALTPGSNPGRLARHWHLAGCHDRAAAALTAARRAVPARAYPEADGNYELAIQLARWLPDAGPDLLEQAARAASWAQHPDRAAMRAADALAQSGAAAAGDRARLLERLGRNHWEAGDLRAAVEAGEQAVTLLGAEPPSTSQARVLAALATWRMLLASTTRHSPSRSAPSRWPSRPARSPSTPKAWPRSASFMLSRASWTPGWPRCARHFASPTEPAALRTSSGRRRTTCTCLISAGRFAEALEVGRSGTEAARSLDAPPALRWVLDNNTAAVLITIGQWAEADQLLTDLLSESAASVTRYLQLLQLELAVGRGEHERAAELAAALGKAPEDPRLAGPLHACLAEQAPHAGDLATAADEVAEGLTALKAATLAEEEARLLAAGARVSADLALLPEPVRPRGLAAGWEPLAGILLDRAAVIVGQHPGRPEVVAFGALVAAEHARQHGSDDRATWRAAAEVWQTASQPYREAYAGCARLRPRSGPGGASRPPAPWPRARASPASCRPRRC